ncbi:hypothetical protein SFRURICE_018999 [Spodoptera frugiperda]|nr:hypothetical protein SFRURICE_018999 [Spodoptera frugiperda]
MSPPPLMPRVSYLMGQARHNLPYRCNSCKPGSTKQYCNTRTEICCRIETSGAGIQGSLGVGSGFQASQGSGVFQGSSQGSQSSFGAGFNGNRGSGFGTQFASGSGFNSNKFGASGSGFGSGFKSTSQSNFIETDSFSAGSDNSGVYRPGAVGSGLKPGVPYLPPVDTSSSGSNVVTASYLPPVVTTPRPFSPRPVTTPRPYSTPKPYVPSTGAPGYLPPDVTGADSNVNTFTTSYYDGGTILDETRTTQRPPIPTVPIGDLPAGCAAALKCTPIEYCTAEGIISNTTVVLTRDQEAYRVPLTDCKDLASGIIGKCCRDPFYTDPWPVNQLGQWVPGAFGNDGKYVPDNRGSSNNQPGVTVRPPITGSTLLNTNLGPTPKPILPVGPNQVTQGFAATTVTPGSFVQKTQYGQGSYSQGGQGQVAIQGQGKYGVAGQGSQGFGVSQGFGQGIRQGSGSAVVQGGGFGVSQGQGQIVTQGQGQLVSQGQGVGVIQGQGQGVRQGSGQFVSQGQGVGLIQGGGQVVTQGQGFAVTQGQRQGVSQGVGIGVVQGEGVGISRGQGFAVTGGQGQYTTQGQGSLVSRGQGQTVSQGVGFGVTQGQGSAVSQGQGFGVSQGQGFGISQGGGVGVSQGNGFRVSQGGGFGVSQGIGFGVQQGQGQAILQGQGQKLIQGGGSYSISNGGGFGVENEFAESVQRVYLPRYTGSGECGILNPQKPYGNRKDLEVDFAEIPWQAMILLQTNRSLLCGGVITRPDVVITSASCVEGLKAENVLIKGGEWKLGIDEEPLPFQIVQVKTILRHPQYKAGNYVNDAAILVLSENLRLAKNIWPICLPSSKDTLDAFYNGAAHLLGSIMHSMNVSLLNPGECESKITQDYPHLLEHYSQDSCVCGQPTNPANNICKVDIGSALACTTGDNHYVLRGIYSWDSGCQTGNQLASFYKFDLEWYEWAIGLIESVRFEKYTVIKVTKNKIITQGTGTKTTYGTGVQGTTGFGIKGSSGFGIKGSSGAIKSSGATATAVAGSGLGIKGFEVSGAGAGLGIKGFGLAGQGQSGQFNQFGSANFGTGSGEFSTEVKGPIQKTFTTTITEKKFFQTEPKFVTYTTKPEIISYTTKPEIVTFTTKPEIVTFTTKPEYFTYTTKPKYVTYTTKPEIVTYTTKPEIVTYTTKPEIITYTTKPKIVTYTTKPQIIRYDYQTSGSQTNQQVVAPSVSFNPSFSEVVGAGHVHDAKCKCLEGK